jgi:hypothetical protein
MKRHSGQEISDFFLSQFSNNSLEIHVLSVFPLNSVVTWKQNWPVPTDSDFSWLMSADYWPLQWTEPEENLFHYQQQ